MFIERSSSLLLVARIIKHLCECSYLCSVMCVWIESFWDVANG